MGDQFTNAGRIKIKARQDERRIQSELERHVLVKKASDAASHPHDPINHPSHYISESGLEVVEVIEAFAPTNPHRSHAIKYLLRAGRKPGAIGVEKRKEDLRKAKWWIDREISRLDGMS